MAKVITIVLLIIVSCVFVGTYEGLNLVYYEESKADRYSDVAAAPFLIYFFVAFFVERYRYSIKDNRVLDAIKQSLVAYPCAVILYFAIIRPVISGSIIFTNDIFKTDEETRIIGTVIDKLDVEGPKIGNFEFEVKTNTAVYRFDTHGVEIDKYKIGDTFNEKMTKGFWGLLTKDR